MAVTDATTGVSAPTATRWAGVGQSVRTDPWVAGVEATQHALDGRKAELIVLFGTDRYACEEMLAGVAEQAGAAQVVGCSAPSYIAADGPSQDGLVALALGGPGFSAHTAAAASIGGPRAAGRLATEPLPSHERDDRRELVMLLTASQAGDQNEIVRGAYGVLGAGIPLVGGCTGKSMSAEASCQFHGTEVLLGAVVAAALVSDGPIGIGVGHGLMRIGERMVITRSKGGRVMEIDGRPALDAYLDLLEAPAQASRDPDAFAAFAAAHPLGLSRSSGPDQARCVDAADFEDRSLLCVADVPQGSLAWLMHENVATTVASAADAGNTAVQALGGADPLALLVFDCIGRRKLLGDEGALVEVDALAGVAPGTPLAGFYTLGEIARTQGVRGFHNKAVVALALG